MTRISICSVLAVTLLAAGGRPLASTANDALAIRTPAPDFALRDGSGRVVGLASQRGKVVLLDFWATWCTGCKVEIPWFTEFESKYKRRGLVSIGVAMDDEGWTTVTPYLRQHPINYRIVIGTPVFAESYPIAAMPKTILIDRRGRIANAHVGVVDKAESERNIRELLDER